MSALAWLAEIAWKATVVLAAAFAANYALRRGPAAMRHFVWTMALAVLLVLPLAISIGPKWSAAAPVVAPADGVTVVVRGTDPPAPWTVPYGWLYAVGALAVAARFAAGIGRTSSMVRRAGIAAHAAALADGLRRALGIGRRVRVVESRDAAVPMTWGILRPVAVLPVSAREWPHERLHAVLLHELVHVSRLDLLAQAVGQAACCLYWFHPLVWLAARGLRKEREAACDDAVLNRGLAPADYAGHLMELARSMAARQASLADAPAMAESSDLEARVRALLDRGRNRAPLSRRVAMTVAALVCALVLPVATLSTHAQTAAGRGALAGIVTDPSGSRVPGSVVIAKNLDGSNQETTKANAAGEYQFGSIPPGRYAIEVKSAGFAVAKMEIVVTAGTAARADAQLSVGNVTEMVTVKGTSVRVPLPRATAQNAAPAQRIPIGGNVKMCRLIRQPRPVYPEDLKAQGVTGRVVIQAIISTTGSVLNPRVINTDVHPALAKAALDSFSQWQYEPTLLNGEPVEVMTTATISFELDQ
jgi:TonB family protein